MGAYEVFKTAQVELCSTLAAELEGTRVYTYAIGPGLVKTDTAMRSIAIVAGAMGMTTDEFYAMNDSHILSVEEAGCGFAVSVLAAERYHGQEIGSIQALLDCGLLGQAGAGEEQGTADAGILPLVEEMIGVFEAQYAGWASRNIFEKQWVLRDFKKTVGMSAEQFKTDLERLKEDIDAGKTESISAYRGHFGKLRVYFQRQHQLLQGFEKNPVKLKENSDILMDWVEKLGQIGE